MGLVILLYSRHIMLCKHTFRFQLPHSIVEILNIIVGVTNRVLPDLCLHQVSQSHASSLHGHSCFPQGSKFTPTSSQQQLVDILTNMTL